MLQAAKDQFAQFWTEVIDKAETLGLDEPIVPRKRRLPRGFEDGSVGTKSNKKCEYYYRFGTVWGQPPKNENFLTLS